VRGKPHEPEMLFLWQSNRVTVHIDGAARGNPGPASAGVVIHGVSAEKPLQIGRFLGRRTNNQAEYEALLVALNELVHRQGTQTPVAVPPEIVIRTDSELLFSQMTGRYRIKDQQLATLAREAKKLMSRLPRVTFERIPRTENREADKVANRALDRALKLRAQS
jgi:ribonuclease HI